MHSSIALRPADAGDLDVLTELSAAVGWPHTAHDLELMMRLAHGYTAVEDDGGQRVGVGFWWPNGPAAATLGLVIVAPGQQGRGIGRQLMDRLLQDTGERAVALIATSAGAPLYEQLGFRVVGAIRQFQGEHAGAEATHEAVRAARPDGLDTAIELDAEARGTPRADVIRRLAEAGEMFILEGSGPRGFAIRRAFGRGSVVGPIVAPDEAGAIALFDAAAPPGFVRVDCAADAGVLGSHLQAAGLEPVDEANAMLLGTWPPRSASLKSWALASQALG